MHFALGLINHIEDDIKAGLVPTLEVLEMLKKAIEDIGESK